MHCGCRNVGCSVHRACVVRGRSALCQVRQLQPIPMEGVAISAWKKDQARQYLRAAGKPDYSASTAAELKSYIMELEAALVVKLKVNMNSSKKDIAEECRTKGIVIPDNVTKAWMMRKLRTVVQDQIVVTFGEHAGKTFHEVRTEFPGYVGLAMKTASEDPTADPRLAHFGRWVAHIHGPETVGEMTTGSPDLDPPSRTVDAEDDLGAPSDAASSVDGMSGLMERFRALELRVSKIEDASWVMTPTIP